jgi:CheY-like chemotaxis protein
MSIIGEGLATDSNQMSCQILVLDFDEKILITFEKLFEGTGFHTTATWSIHEAISCLEKKHFDVILIGDHPPEIDAEAFLRFLQTTRSDVPCIVMRAARSLPQNSHPDRLVTCMPGCATETIFEEVCQHVRRFGFVNQNS